VSDAVMPRIASGDPAAMRECLDRYAGLIWTLALRFLGNRSEAEDAVQEAFIDLWKSAAKYRPELGSEVAFVTVLVRRRLIDRKRRAGRAPAPGALPADVPAGATADALEIGDEAALAREVLDELVPAQRRVLELAVCNGLSHQEVADRTGLPLGTVKTYVRRGLMHVRERLQAAGRPEVRE
jgi:RNA polymerase sigma factor (sigma-70 family)